jgi:hypothetical protein
VVLDLTGNAVQGHYTCGVFMVMGVLCVELKIVSLRWSGRWMPACQRNVMYVIGVKMVNLTLDMEATCFSKMFVSTSKIQCHNPEDHNLNSLEMNTNYKTPCHAVFSSPVVCPVLLCVNTSCRTLFLGIYNVCFSLRVRNQVSHLYRTTDGIIILYILIFRFSGRRLADKRF